MDPSGTPFQKREPPHSLLDLLLKIKQMELAALSCKQLFFQEGRGFESLLGRDIFCLKISNIFLTTSVRESKMNAVVRAQWTFQMLTLQTKYLFHQSLYSKTWVRKFLVPVAQMVRAMDLNQKVVSSSPSCVETLSVSKTSTLSQEHPFVSRKWMQLPTHVFDTPVNNTTIRIFWSSAGVRLNINMASYKYRILITKIRQSHDRLIFTMEVSMPGNTVVILTCGPDFQSVCPLQKALGRV